MNVRSKTFWALDFVSGGKRASELKVVESLNNRTMQATKRRLELLDEHLKYVAGKVPYYRRLANLSSLIDFPVLGKADIREHDSELLAEGFDQSKLHSATTSGSTGTPFRVFQNREKRRRADAEAMYFGRLAGYHIGNPLWYLKIWTRRSSRSRLSFFARNMRPIDVSTFNEKDVPELFYKIGKRRGPHSIVGHSSSLETIARTIVNDGELLENAPQLAAIVGHAEPLSQEAREVLWHKLGTAPVGRYGMEELGMLAQQKRTLDGSYDLNLASHVVEVLGIEDNRRVPAGELGRVVVTDLVNKAQPLIRYDTGDLAAVKEFENGSGFVESFAQLEGRSRDRLFDIEDRPLSPLIAYNFWWMFPEILQYQIVQSARGRYVLRLEVEDDFRRESELVEEFRKQVGDTAYIDVEYSAANYRHNSGKRRTIVSEYVPPTR